MSEESARPRILVVDDNKENVDLIKYFLKSHNYQIEKAYDGEEALEMAGKVRPDLILLDVMLPKMNGFDVCKTLKKSTSTSFIPVIMITALKELKDKIQALEAGADDFISKPFENVELLTRVKSLLRIKHYHDELQQKNRELMRMDQFKDELVHLIVHDMKNPIFVIQGNLQMMGMGMNDASALNFKKYVDRIDRSTQALLKMVMNLVDISKFESGKMKVTKEVVQIKQLLEFSVKKAHDLPENANKRINLKVPADIVKVYIDQSIIERVFENVLAFSASNTGAEGEVTVELVTEGNEHVIKIRDNGTQIPAKFREAIFDKYSQVEIKNEGYRVGRGLGFTFSRLAMEVHDGDIYLDKTATAGNCFVIRFPKYEKRQTEHN